MMKLEKQNEALNRRIEDLDTEARPNRKPPHYWCFQFTWFSGWARSDSAFFDGWLVRDVSINFYLNLPTYYGRDSHKSMFDAMGRGLFSKNEINGQGIHIDRFSWKNLLRKTLWLYQLIKWSNTGKNKRLFDSVGNNSLYCKELKFFWFSIHKSDFVY